jgi:hypothetical protein
MIKRVIFFVLIVLNAAILPAQDLDEVFDDNGLSNIDNAVSVSLSNLVEGVLSLRFEHCLRSNLSFALEGGLVLYNGLIPMKGVLGSNIKNYYTVPDSMHAGYFIGSELRLYAADQWGYFTGMDISFRRRKGDFFGDYEFMMGWKFGYKYLFPRKLFIEASLGLGIYAYGHRSIEAYDPFSPIPHPSWKPEFVTIGLAVPIKVSLGYAF